MVPAKVPVAVNLIFGGGCGGLIRVVALVGGRLKSGFDFKEL